MKGANVAEERIEIEPVLESVLRYCLKDARERMEKGEQVAPFSALAVGDTLFMEEHAADTAAETAQNVTESAAQTAAATIGTSAILSEINWLTVASASVVAALLSLLTSVAGLPELEE